MIQWTPELEETILTRLMDGESLRQICKSEGMPDRESVRKHKLDSAEFSAKCACAREEQADVMDDRILEVAQKVEDGKLDPKSGQVIIAAFQWRAAKLKPKTYGDKQAHSLENPDGTAIQFVTKSILEK